MRAAPAVLLINSLAIFVDIRDQLKCLHWGNNA
jgi:hypothetical protein